jgi:hypothetical protein
VLGELINPSHGPPETKHGDVKSYCFVVVCRVVLKRIYIDVVIQHIITCLM